MKNVFISDIHGSLKYARRAIEILEEEKGEFLILLGDILYHGPRNPLPEEYNPKGVAELLNKYREKIICVRGNCDSEVDAMMLDFPIMSDYTMILEGKRRFFLTHGHIYNESNMPPISKGDILIHGHTHIPLITEKHGIYILNPGSISYPKEGNPHSYGVIKDNVFYIKDIQGECFKEVIL